MLAVTHAPTAGRGMDRLGPLAGRRGQAGNRCHEVQIAGVSGAQQDLGDMQGEIGIDAGMHHVLEETTLDGVVKRIEPYGAFVEILPNQDGLLHISEVAMERIPDIRDVLSEGDEIKVRIIDIDGNDRIKLSKRVILEEEARARGEDIPELSAPPPRDRSAPRWKPRTGR